MSSTQQINQQQISTVPEVPSYEEILAQPKKIIKMKPKKKASPPVVEVPLVYQGGWVPPVPEVPVVPEVEVPVVPVPVMTPDTPMPELGEFLQEFGLYQEELGGSLAEDLQTCRVIWACKNSPSGVGHIKPTEWRVKQYRIYQSALDSGLMDELKKALGAHQEDSGITLSMEALKLHSTLVSLADKKQGSRSGRVPLAMNTRLHKDSYDILCQLVKDESGSKHCAQAFIYAQDVYAYQSYEKATALALSSDPSHTEFMRTQFCGGWWLSEEGLEVLAEGERLYGTGTKTKAPPPKPATVASRALTKMTPAELQALIAQASALMA
jgi:hypothetical protein